MTFFYNLNKKLQGVVDMPKSEHMQLNERANNKPVGEGIGDAVKQVGSMAKKLGQKAITTLGHGDDAEMMRDLQRKMGVPQTGLKPGAEPNPKVVKEKMSPAKAQQFAALAEPKDKITFADKIAGAKKEVDEMLGDVAAEAMKAAIGKKKVVADEGSTGDYSAKKARAGKDIGKPGKAFAKIAKGAAERYGSEESGKRVAGAVLNKLRHKGANEGEMDEGFPTVAGARAELNKRKVGDVTHGAKHDVEEIPGGRRVTRRVDDKGYSVGSDTDDEGNTKSSEKRGRGRPKKADKAPERVTAKATKHKGGRKVKEGDFGPMEEGAGEGDDLVKLSKVIASCQTREQLLAAQKMANNFLKKHQQGGISNIGSNMRRLSDVDDTLQQKNRELKGGEELEEKAVSKKQQKFMGMVHATQKGEKAPSKEVAKVAKTMKKKDAEDFASTKHKGLPEKKAKKKEKTEEQGGTKTPTASSGFSFGQGIYDSVNRELEAMIAESMNISMSSNSDGANGSPTKTLTVTATEEDASYLAQILKSAGLGGDQGGCGCGSTPCSCSDEGEVVDENSPDWPTNQETSNDAFQYSGGLNKPKSTGQTTVPVIAGQDGRTSSYAEEEQDAIKRMMEMAGIKEAAKPDFTDVDKDGDKKESWKKAEKDKEEKKVEESILSMKHLWNEYKG